MMGFPFDSHVTTDVDGNPIYDRAITSEPYRKLLKELFKTGIMPTNSTNMQVTASGGMNVVVNAGFAMVEGCMKLEEDNRTLAVQASDSTYDRIDTVVLRLDDNDDMRICDFYIVKGVASENPVRPALTREGSIYEIGLADIFVTKQITAITAQKITDTRFEGSRCGVVSSISEFDTSTLDYQINAWCDEQKEEFSSWVDSIKNILDSSTAGHLQTEIDNLADRLDDTDSRIDDINTLIGSSTTDNTILGDIQKTQTNVSKNADEITALKNSLKWKLHKTITGLSSVSLPTNFSELHVVLSVPTVNAKINFHFIRDELTSTDTIYRQGWAFDNANNMIGLTVSKSALKVTYFYFNNVVITNAQVDVYYR